MIFEGRAVDIGGFTSEVLLEKLTDAGVRLNEYAHTLWGRMDVDEQPPLGTIHVAVRTVAELGFASGATLEQIFARAARDNLALCPLVAGPYLRLATLDQESSRHSMLREAKSPADSLIVASPLSGRGEGPRGFYLRVVDDVPWLRGYCCDDDYLFAPSDAFVFHNPSGA